MNILFIIFGLFIIIAIASYLVLYIRRIIAFIFGKKKRIQIPISILTFLIFLGAGYYIIGFTFMVALLYLLVFALLTQGIHFVICKLSKSGAPIFNKIYNLGLIPLILTIIIMTFGYFNMTNIVRTEYDLTSDKLDKGESVKIAMIADLHLDNALTASDLEEPCLSISQENADILVLDGDIFDESTSRESMEKACQILGNVNTKYGIYYVYGNHDKNTYGGNPNYTEDDMENELEKNGIVVLNDEVVDFEDFQLIGRMDYSGDFSGGKRMDFSTLMDEADSSKYIIDLDHQPQETEIAAKAGADLQLSGHTHGGQIWPLSHINSLFHFNDYEYGLHQIGDYNIIVTSGISGWGLPIRTEKHSEYVIINISPKY